MQKTLHLACAVTLFTSTILSTPSRADEKTVSWLDTVTVVATKNPQRTFDIPSMVSVIDVDSPYAAGSSTLKGILQDVPGLEFSGSGRRNGQNITLRGFDSKGIVVLFDGVRQKFESAHDGRFFMDPALLKTAEVIRGPNSTLYGSGGLGGVVSLTTKDASDMLAPGETSGAQLTTGYQSVNDEWLASLSGYTRNDRYDLLANVLTRHSDDVELGDGTTLESEDAVLSALVKLGWSLADDHTLRFNVQGYNNQATEPNNPQVASSDSASDSLVDKRTSSYTSQIAYEYANPDNDWLHLNAKVYYTDTEVEEDIVVATSTNAVGDTIARHIDTVGFTIDNRSVLGSGTRFENTLTYGAEIYREEQNGSDSANGEVGGIPDAKSDFWGVFLQDEIAWDPESIPGEFLMIPGVRLDNYDSKNTTGTSLDANEVSPKFGMTYKPNDWLMVFGNYAKAFRAPTMTEIYTTGTHFTIPGLGSNNFVPNPDLKPETSKTLEYGLGMQFAEVLQPNDQLQFKASRFDIDSKDFIDTQVDFSYAPCCGTTTSVNVPNASLWGAELEGGYENDRIKLAVGYAYLTGKNDDTGAYLTNITPSTFTTNIGFKLPEYHSVAGVRSTYADAHDKVNDVSAERDSYTTHNVYYEWKPEDANNVVVNLGIDNLFDESYSRVFAGSAEPGRNYKVQVSYQW